MTKNNESMGSSNHDLEIKDAVIIFKAVWSQLEIDYGRPKLIFPKEIIWLGGAPGAGKGTNTPFVQKERGFTAPPIVVSSLLDSPEAKKIKDAGGMVGDREVIGLLFAKLLSETYETGVIVDGFPRTQVQVECLKIFYHKLIELKNEFVGTAVSKRFRYPQFRITVLFVSEKVSIDRQLGRGRAALSQISRNDGDAEVRATDFNEGLARNRYRMFKERTYEALKSLRDIFHYHFIDAEGDLETVQWNIAKEFQYQSSLELDHGLFEDMRDIPLANELVVHTRQELVKRLEDYHDRSHDLFLKVVEFIANEIIPDVKIHLTSGFSIINTANDLLRQTETKFMLVDILAERGFHVAIEERMNAIPRRVSLETGDIECEERYYYTLYIQFKGSEIRRGH
jgi:adenylate kinase